MPPIDLTGTTGIGITKQIAAEGDCLPTNPVIGEFACLFVEARGGLPHQSFCDKTGLAVFDLIRGHRLIAVAPW